MKIQQYRPTFLSDVPKAEKWVEPLLLPIHDQIKNLTLAMQNSMTFGDNLNAELRDIKLDHDNGTTTTWTDIDIKTLRGAPIGVYPIFWDYDDYAQFKWKLKDLSTIRVKIKWTTAPGEQVSVRLLIIGK
jgi:hypothetical protein